MKCPNCANYDSKVLDSRASEESNSIRRRRECTKCNYRFTTYEKIEKVPIIVIKKNNTRESFNREKLIKGLLKACEKRPVSMEQIEELVDKVELDIRNSMDKEVKSSKIGDMVMDELKKLDEIAFVRFASVYRQFKDISLFVEEINKLL